MISIKNLERDFVIIFYSVCLTEVVYRPIGWVKKIIADIWANARQMVHPIINIWSRTGEIRPCPEVNKKASSPKSTDRRVPA